MTNCKFCDTPIEEHEAGECGILIPLTKGAVTVINQEDYDSAKKHKWHLTGNYARTCLSYGNNLLLHRMIMGAKKGQQVDHVNGNGLDNRRSNLRICTNLQNSHNQKKAKNKTSEYKGVSWAKRQKKWMVVIWINKISVFLGYYRNEIFAAGVYDQKAKEAFGEFARLNFPEKDAELTLLKR